MMALTSSMSVPGGTQMTCEVITSPTFASAGLRSSPTTRTSTSRSVNMPATRPWLITTSAPSLCWFIFWMA
jgi:hypothetical protein